MNARAEKGEGKVKRMSVGGPSVVLARGTLAVEADSQAGLRPEPFVT